MRPGMKHVLCSRWLYTTPRLREMWFVVHSPYLIQHSDHFATIWRELWKKKYVFGCMITSAKCHSCFQNGVTLPLPVDAEPILKGQCRQVAEACVVAVGVTRSVVAGELSYSCLFWTSEWSLNFVTHSSLCTLKWVSRCNCHNLQPQDKLLRGGLPMWAWK